MDKHLATSASSIVNGVRFGTRYYYTFEECRAHRNRPYFRFRNQSCEERFIEWAWRQQQKESEAGDE